MSEKLVEHCDFCGFELTEYDIEAQSPLAWWRCCKEHSNHATYPQMWLLKKELGVAYSEPTKEDRVCGVCGLPLSDEDMSGVHKTHVTLTCIFHRRYAHNVNHIRTRTDLGYPEQLKSRPIDIIIQKWKLSEGS